MSGKGKLSDFIKSKGIYHHNKKHAKSPNYSDSDSESKYDLNSFDCDSDDGCERMDNTYDYEEFFYPNTNDKSVENNIVYDDVYLGVNKRCLEKDEIKFGKKYKSEISSSYDSSESIKKNNFKWSKNSKKESTSDSDGLDHQCPICNMNLSVLTDKFRNIHVIGCLDKSNKCQASEKIDPPPEILYDDPFAVECTLPGCKKKYEARHYPAHYCSEHGKCKETYSCPICLLQSDNQRRTKYMLLDHFKKDHKDIPLIFKPDEVVVEKLDTSVYTTQIAKEEDLVRECHICYCEFQKGDILARLTCFCLYHKSCIDVWFSKQKECPIPHSISKN
jgi:hypothetical protein